MFKFLKNLLRKSSYAQPIERGSTKWSIQDDYSYITEAYEKLVWCYACIGAIAGAVSSLNWLLYDRSGKKMKEIENHPILDLVNGRVNPDFTSADFFDLWATSLAAQGKFFARYSNFIKYDKNLEIYPMYTHLTAPIVGEGKNTLNGFQYDLDGLNYAPNIILWDRFIDPINFYDGLSPVRAAARTMDTENQSVDWNKNMFDNLAVPPGGISLMNASTELIKEAKARWKTDVAGPKNARMPLIFDSEKLEYISFGLNAIDMDFLNQKKVNRVEICAAFNVPGQVVGDPENQTFANFEQALKSFWMNTVLAKYVNKISKKLNSEIVSAWDPRYLLRADTSEIQVLQEDENTKSERIRGEFESNLLTQNEAREMLGYEATKKGDMFNFELSSALSDELINDPGGEGGEGEGGEDEGGEDEPI
jgi:HK97 family phage portal protein